MLHVIAPNIFVFEISPLPISKSRTPAFNSIEIITSSPLNDDLEDNQRKKMTSPKIVENMFSTSKPVYEEESFASRSYKGRRLLPQNLPRESESEDKVCLCTVCLSLFSQPDPREE
ncbi:hypothetical protein JTB14_034079 [Gonioctena quinquepunctata]|nr:hypothetical protein JTB14_034079 [Gonioctena quinquepunctata]